MASEAATSPVAGDTSTEAPPAAESSSKAEQTSAPRRASRRRTKTGCLTCRKRRIKCGEERPICNNCIKSKRHCEGYNQRVVFKTPNTDFRVAGGGSTLQFHTASLPGTARNPGQTQILPSSQPYPLTPLLPRGPEQPEYGLSGDPVSATAGHNNPMGTFFPYGTPQPEQFHQQTPLPEQYPPSSETFGQSSTQTQFPTSGQPPPTPMSASVQGHQPYEYSQYGVFSNLTSAQEQTSITATNAVPGMSFPMSTQNTPSEQHPSRPEWQSNIFDEQIGHQRRQQQQPPAQYYQPTHPQPHTQGYNQFATPVTPSQESHAPSYSDSRNAGNWYRLQSGGTISPTQDLDQAAVENEDDEYFDLNSDEEMEIDPTQGSFVGHGSQGLGQVLTVHQAHTDELQARRFDSFLYEGILDSYRAEWVANPLKNPQTSRVFAHFVHSTGPSLSIFERHTRNTSVLFSEGPVPRYQQGLWTYTMPMMALHHQGLLHAMLALASIHIAKIQSASVTPSFKHYAYSLKRVQHCLRHPHKRNQITTLAASLLLGFYEIMAAEHSKWSSHLAGARQLLNEIDFPRMHKELRRRKAERQAYEAFEAQRVAALGYPYNMRRPSQQWHAEEVPDIDEGIISDLMGYEVRYDEYGHVYGKYSAPKAYPADIDLGRFEVWQDLHWWYCKQDVYQSIISGNQLLRDFRQWSDCPPRAPIGREDAVVGSNDHLFLLLARVADFAARDRERKLKVLAANGGMWKPPRGPPPQGAGSHPRPAPPTNAPNTSASAVPSTPTPRGPPGTPVGIPMSQFPFHGMIPSSAEVQMPSSYASHSRPSTYGPQSPPQTPSPSVYDLDAATTSALAEWGRIQAALSSFPNYLGDLFQPLTEQEQLPKQTPFGPALFYRSFDIACMWAVYHMAHIIHLRSHPSMPAASMLAQGVAAPQTAAHAIAIGRIAAGIVPNPIPPRLNPSLGAALTESTMPLFFAGVQYREYAQREWLVTRVRNIEERTGWASAGLIAAGCEKAWVKAYEAKRGPKWEPLLRAYEEVDERRHWATGYRWLTVDGRVMGRGLPEDEIARMQAAGEGPRHAAAEEEDVDRTDRRLLKTSEKARLHWATGIIGMEDDVKRMSME